MHGLEIYPDTLSPQHCQQIIHLFNNDDRRTIGTTADGIMNDRKKSTDIYCNFDDPQFIEYNKLIAPAVLSMTNKIKEQYLFLDYCDYWKVDQWYNIQYYGDGEGYFKAHCEHSSVYPHRMLAWMIYLNTAECGTEFPYQKIKVRALQGQGAMWSAAWTHPHKGVTPNIGDKYIITGWCVFNRPTARDVPLPDALPYETSQWNSHYL